MDKIRLDMTRHAVRRSQQRGITEEEMEFVMEFGKESHAGKGSYSYWLDQKARLRAKAELGDAGYRRLARRNIYVIASERGTVLTAAHKRARPHRFR